MAKPVLDDSLVMISIRVRRSDVQRAKRIARTEPGKSYQVWVRNRLTDAIEAHRGGPLRVYKFKTTNAVAVVLARTLADARALAREYGTKVEREAGTPPGASTRWIERPVEPPREAVREGVVAWAEIGAPQAAAG